MSRQLFPDTDDQTIDDIVASQGWTDATVLDLLWEYVHNQNDPRAVREHFLQAAEEVEVIDEPANRTSTSGVWIQGENVTFLCTNSLGAYENEEEA
jgi:hypothetical protein